MKVVAIVDDDFIQHVTIKRMAEVAQATRHVLSFENGKEALDFLIRHTLDANVLPDIILLDINMPVMNGFEFLEHFNGLTKKLCKRICIYVLSSSTDINDKKRIENNSNVEDFICKPLSMQQLKSITGTSSTETC